MSKDTWILMSPLLAVMGVGVIMFALGLYWMIADSIRDGLQPFMCGIVAIGMPAIVVGMVWILEERK